MAPSAWRPSTTTHTTKWTSWCRFYCRDAQTTDDLSRNVNFQSKGPKISFWLESPSNGNCREWSLNETQIGWSILTVSQILGQKVLCVDKISSNKLYELQLVDFSWKTTSKGDSQVPSRKKQFPELPRVFGQNFKT